MVSNTLKFAFYLPANYCIVIYQFLFLHRFLESFIIAFLLFQLHLINYFNHNNLNHSILPNLLYFLHYQDITCFLLKEINSHRMKMLHPLSVKIILMLTDFVLFHLLDLIKEKILSILIGSICLYFEYFHLNQIQYYLFVLILFPSKNQKHDYILHRKE